jgi:hypothetical protein
MTQNHSDEISALLLEAEEAHGVYEATELEGVYDSDWARWYGQYAVDHGIGDLLGHQVAADRVAQSLATAFAAYEELQPKPSGSWAEYAARRIAAEL